MIGEIRFFTPRHGGTGKLADFYIELQAPWGSQSCRAMIVSSIRDSKPRVLWPKAGEFFATTPTSREERDVAEAHILKAWSAWKIRHGIA